MLPFHDSGPALRARTVASPQYELADNVTGDHSFPAFSAKAAPIREGAESASVRNARLHDEIFYSCLQLIGYERDGQFRAPVSIVAGMRAREVLERSILPLVDCQITAQATTSEAAV